MVYASFESPPAATAIAVGNEVPSSSRIAVPRSKSAHVQIVHVVQDLLVRGRVLRGKASVIGGEKELADLFLDAHVAQSGFHPVVCGGGQFLHRAPGGGGALVSNILF